MGLSLRPDHLRRYGEIARLLLKYGRSDLLFHAGLTADELTAEPGSQQTGDSLAHDLEQLGPTFVKVGQLLSTRADLLPPGALHALARLQDGVEPFPFAQVEEIVTAELGVRMSKAFAHFDNVTLAAASLGQVHRATLRDGREVAVKVQRPGVRDTVVRDMETMEEVADFLERHTESGRRMGLTRMATELRTALLRELDYRLEAQNMTTIGRNLAQFARVVVPQPIDGYSAGRVLTMDYIAGRKITAVSPVVLADAHASELADELLRAYLHQVIIDGVFHADPHPGNVLLSVDNRIALIDLGMVSRLSPDLQDALLHFLLAVTDSRAAQAADLALRMGERLPHFDESDFRRSIGEIVMRSREVKMGEAPVGRMMLAAAHAAAASGVRLPNELTLLGKTLLNLDDVGRTLAPDFEVHASLRRNARRLMVERMRRSVTPATAFSSLLEARTFAKGLPSRLSRILEALANQELKVRVELIDEGAVMEGLQKVANRITLGLILAALIVGAAMLMRVETSFRIFGYPGLAMIFFLAAAVGAGWMAFSILRSDASRRRT